MAFFPDSVVNLILDTDSTYDVRNIDAGLQLCAIRWGARERKVPSSTKSNISINTATSPEIYASGIVFDAFRSVSIHIVLDAQRLVRVYVGIWFNCCSKETRRYNGPQPWTETGPTSECACQFS